MPMPTHDRPMALQSTPSLRWSVFGGMVATMLGGLLLAFWPMAAADRELQAFCAAQAPGTPQITVQAAAEQLGYDRLVAPADRLVIDDPGGFGRRRCTLALDNQGRVTGPATPR